MYSLACAPTNLIVESFLVILDPLRICTDLDGQAKATLNKVFPTRLCISETT